MAGAVRALNPSGKDLFLLPFGDPAQRFFQARLQRLRGRPAEGFADQPVVGIATAHALEAGDILDLDLLAGQADDQPGQIVDRDHLGRSDIHRPGEAGAQQTDGALDAFVNVQDRVCSPSPQT